MYSTEEVAYGFIRVANESMARPIRNLTTMKGYDITKHSLSCFGGAGPQHCCAIAKSLGMKKIYVHKHSGILSAYGLSLADVVIEKQEPFSGELSSSPPTEPGPGTATGTATGTACCLDKAVERLLNLEAAACAALESQGFRKVYFKYIYIYIYIYNDNNIFHCDIVYYII